MTRLDYDDIFEIRKLTKWKFKLIESKQKLSKHSIVTKIWRRGEYLSRKPTTF
jgi:hypothetical protein